MLKKLLEYDMRSMKKLWRIMGIVLPCATVAAALAIRFWIVIDMFDVNTQIALGMLSIMVITLGYAAIITFSVLNSLFIAKRMGSDFFSKAGQLTFMIPVKRDVLFLSKFLNSIIWISISNLSIVAVVLTCMLIIPAPETGLISLDAFIVVAEFFKSGVADSGVLFVVNTALVIMLMMEFNLFMACFLNFCVIKCRSTGGYGMYVGIMMGILFGAMIIFALCVEGYSLLVGIYDGASRAFLAMLMLVALVIMLGVFCFWTFFSSRDKMRYDLELK